MAKRVRATAANGTSKALTVPTSTAIAPAAAAAVRDAGLHDLAIAPMLADDSEGSGADAARVATRSRGLAQLSNTGTPTNAAIAAAPAAPPADAAAKGKAAAGSAAPAAGAPGGAGDGKHVMLPAFLSKTYEIFSMPEFASVCGWNASGDTIIVSQLEAFVALVLPRFFKHRNFPSFVRQLNLYGFHKTVLDSKRLEFQHPYFKRDRPDLLHYIKRKVSSGAASQQALVNSSVQNSRLEAHREISDNLLREMKELRQRSENMEKRLRELEIDNAIVRSDNLKLWKHLETAKDKQLIMQEKLKKIMWILFQIYRGKQGIPKLSGNDSANVISEDSLLGPKEFREVLRYLAMDEPPLLPRSSSSAVDVPAQGSRKRKFVEVPADAAPDQFGSELYKFDTPSVVEVGSPMTGPSSAMTLASAPSPAPQVASASVAPPAVASPPPASSSQALSIFSPAPAAPRPEFAPGELSALISNAVPASLRGFESAMAAAHAAAATAAAPGGGALEPAGKTAAAGGDAIDFIDDDLPLLSDSETYNFGEGEEQVMKKLEDFESSLLDEYDVGCLDTLLQQLKSSTMGKPAAPDVSVIDPDEIFVGGPDVPSPRNA